MIAKRTTSITIVATLVVTLSAIGCVGGDARVEIAAANLLDVASDSLARALVEYHDEIVSFDVRQEQDAILAFTNRITSAPDNPDDLDDPNHSDTVKKHTREFAAALAKLRADAQTESSRHIASMSNVKLLRETAATLRKLAVESLSLEDETKRYLTDALVQLREYRARDRTEPRP